MPNFSVEDWGSFKTIFYGVIQFVLYVFKMLYQAFTDKPMLYVFLFFPIFALIFFLIFDLLTNMVPFKPLFSGLKNKSDVPYVKSGGFSSKPYSSDVKSGNNLALRHNAEISDSTGKVKNLSSYSPKGNDYKSKSVNLRESGFSVKPSASLSSPGTPAVVNSKNGAGASPGSPSSAPTSKAPSGVSLGSQTVPNVSTSDGFKGSAAFVSNKLASVGVHAVRAVKQANLNQEEYDKHHNMKTDISYSFDENGNTVTHTQVTNTRTGEVVSERDTVHHKDSN